MLQGPQKKVAVIVQQESESLLSDVISAAKEKLKTPGSQLVLEKNGTLIDDKIFLLHWIEEMFMLLDDNDTWSSITPGESGSTTPSENVDPNTVQVHSKNSTSDNAGNVPLI